MSSYSFIELSQDHRKDFERVFIYNKMEVWPFSIRTWGLSIVVDLGRKVRQEWLREFGWLATEAVFQLLLEENLKLRD